MRQFRFGVSAFGAKSADGWRELARRAETLGFDVLSVPDHIGALYSPFEALLDAVHVTSRIHLAPLVLNNDFRHPALVARQAAMLQELSGGRFELGIGAGHAFTEYAELGIPFDPAAVRVARFGESVSIIRRLMAGETVDFAGTHYTIANHRIYPEPATRVPIMAGGNGRTLLRHAAKHADTISITGLGKTLADGQRHDPSGFYPAAVDERIALIRETAGERFADIELNVLVQAVVATDDREKVASELAPRFGLPIEVLLETPYVLIGSQAEIAGQLRANRERWGISYISTFWPNAEALAPVIPLMHE